MIIAILAGRNNKLLGQYGKNKDGSNVESNKWSCSTLFILILLIPKHKKPPDLPGKLSWMIGQIVHFINSNYTNRLPITNQFHISIVCQVSTHFSVSHTTAIFSLLA